MKLDEKRVVITGASQGIGLELSKMLLEKGCIIVGVSRDMSKSDVSNENYYTLDCDVSSPEGVDKVFEFALEKLGEIDIFIANAGAAFYEKMGPANWERYLEVYNLNVFSAFYSAQKMKDRYPNSPYNVVITASAMAFVSIPGYSMYSSTKAALRAFADAYRYELNKDQKIQVIYPIATKTNFFKASGDIPMCWPVQSATHVARKTVKCMKKGKNHINPSLLFSLFKLFSVAYPFTKKLYNIRNKKELAKWLDKQ